MCKSRVCAGIISVSLLAGCQVDGRNAFIKEGIGTNLHTTDVADQAVRLDEYLGSLCYQAGLQYDFEADQTYRCRNNGTFGPHWRVVAFQGMNDIDRRCDAYLSWLDNKRRSRGPKLAQVSAVRTATEAIMGQVSTGEKAITIVGSAFGLLSSAIDNRNSRLIFEIDSASVQNIVLKSRAQYRKTVPIESVNARPQAIHVIREYLNICLPHNIETEINASVTENKRSKGTLEPLIDPRLSVIPRTPFVPVKKQPPPPTIVVNAQSPIEKSLTNDQGQQIQRNLCLTKNIDGVFGSSTRNAIKLMEAALIKGTIDDIRNFNAIIDLPKELDAALLTIGKCPDPVHSSGKPDFLGHLNAFEKFSYDSMAVIKDLQKQMSEYLLDDDAWKEKIMQSGVFDKTTRDALKHMQTNIDGLTITGGTIGPNFPAQFRRALREKRLQREGAPGPRQ